MKKSTLSLVALIYLLFANAQAPEQARNFQINATHTGSVVLQPNGSYSFTLSPPATKNAQDKDGHLYTIVVQGTDQAGNSTSATTTFKVT